MSSTPQIFIEDDGNDTPLAIYIDTTVEDFPRLRNAMKEHGARIVTRIVDARVVLVNPSNAGQIKRLYEEWGTEKGLVDSAWARAAVRDGYAPSMDKYLWNDKINSIDVENEDDVNLFQDNVPEEARASRSLTSSPLHIALDRDSSLSLSPSPPPQAQTRGAIFQRPDGEPRKFFIQMRFMNRMALIRLVKKHGGQTTFDMAQADYCIMSASIADFDILITQLPPGKPAIQSTWLDACDRENRLVDWESFVESQPAPASAISSARKKSMVGTSTTTASSPAKLQKSPSTSKAAPNTFIPFAPKTPAKATALAFSHTLNQDLTREPEPSTEIVATGRGHLFTADDNRFALQAHKWLLHRDPHILDSARDQYLAQKGPHHSAGSWNAHLNRNFSAECKRLRDDAIKAAKSPSSRVKKEEPRTPSTSRENRYSQRTQLARSPTPPTNVVVGPNGNRFTDEDREFAFKLAKKLLLQNPSMTDAELARRICEKAPHHPEGSWKYFVSKKNVDDLNALRLQASKSMSAPASVALKPALKSALPSTSATKPQPKAQGAVAEEDPALYRDLWHTPPPPTQPVRSTNGKVAYPPSERIWIQQMFYVVLRRNPDTPANQIHKYLHQKAPHHSEHAYSSFINRYYKDHYDNVRAQVLRERSQMARAESVNKGPTTSRAPARKQGVDFDQRATRLAIYLHDARTQGLADNYALEALDKDASQACDLASSWAAFYDLHRTFIDRRVARLDEAPSTTPLKRTLEATDWATRNQKQRTSSADTLVVDNVL